MPNQTGPTSSEGKAKSARNAERHGLANFRPVITEADRPQHDLMRVRLFESIKPSTFLQQVAFERLVIACWNMQRALKLEDQLRETLGDSEPMAHAEQLKLAELYHRYYLRYEGSYRAAMRELERLQKLDLNAAIHYGDRDKPVGELHDVQLFQQAAKRNEKRAKSGANQPSVEQFFIQKAMNDPEFAAIMKRVPFDFTKR